MKCRRRIAELVKEHSLGGEDGATHILAYINDSNHAVPSLLALRKVCTEQIIFCSNIAYEGKDVLAMKYLLSVRQCRHMNHADCPAPSISTFRLTTLHRLNVVMRFRKNLYRNCFTNMQDARQICLMHPISVNTFFVNYRTEG